MSTTPAATTSAEAASDAPSAPRWRPGDPIAPLRDQLARGGLLAVPTESSYGLAVDPRSRRGVEAIYRLKVRDAGKPLPVAGHHVDAFRDLGLDVEAPSIAWARPSWPAPLTVVVPLRAEAWSMPAAAGIGSLAVRIPDHPLLVELLGQLGTAVTVTSANRSGEPPLLAPDAVAAWLAADDATVVDGGVLPGGPPSTLVRWHDGGPDVLRAGAYTWDDNVAVRSVR